MKVVGVTAIFCACFAPLARAAPEDTLTFHRDRARTGWNASETVLTPATISRGLRLSWESPQFDAVDGYAARLYASPLYVDGVVFAATSNGFVYAVNAFANGGSAAGAILWRTQLGMPCKLEPNLLDGIPTGVLATPVIDRQRKRIYVTSCEPTKRWQAFALDLADGKVLPRWPVALDEKTLRAPGMNRNAGSEGDAHERRFDYTLQRGALNLSPDGSQLYVTFGDTTAGLLIAVDTLAPKVASTFASVATPHRRTGGIWGPGGAAVDTDGTVFAVTGTNFSGFVDRPHDWSQSVLAFANGPAGLALRGTYTPFNHCATAAMDIDLGSGGITLLPPLDGASSTTSHLAVMGSKQGNIYLLDRRHLPGKLDRRPPCSTDSATDASLLAPDAQSHLGKRGPLNVFGPYSDTYGAMDLARSRSVPALFRDARGTIHVFVTGNTKKDAASTTNVAPSLARLKVMTAPGRPAWLAVQQLDRTLVFENPGSPVVTSNGTRDPVVWVLDPNARRSALLVGDTAPQPVLYALDAMTLQLLWKSAPGQLHASGKYNEPTIARGTVFVGTDRIQAFGPARP
jgi:outer membrane protein assembly factor BamB